MEKFVPIESQEELEKIVKERMTAELERYKDFDTLKDKSRKYDELMKKDLEGTIQTLTENLSQAQGEAEAARQRAQSAENSLLRLRIARESGLPDALAERLTGDNEDQMRADAEALEQLMRAGKNTAPLSQASDPSGADGAWMQLLHNLDT